MKYTAITVDGKPYGVQPTMSKPKPFMGGGQAGYEHDLAEYESHLLTRPRYLRTQGLELLPDGEEFEAREIYQWKGYKQSRWFDCTKEEYEHGGKDFYYRQIVLAPLVKDQDEPSVHQDSSPVVSHSSASGNSDEQKFSIGDLKAAHYAGWYNGMVNSYKHQFSWGEYSKKLNREQNDEVSDTTDDDRSTEAGNQKSEPVNRLKEVVGKWPGDEPLEETLKGVKEESVEQEGSATDFLHEYGINIMEMDDHFNSQLLFAMERYAESYHRRQSLKQSDAVEFAEWCSLNNYGCWGKDKWRNNAGELFTSEELYKLFTLK